MKETTTTRTIKYDDKGKIIEETEVTIEKDDNDYHYIPHTRYIPYSPYPIYPNYPTITWSCNVDCAKLNDSSYKNFIENLTDKIKCNI